MRKSSRHDITPVSDLVTAETTIRERFSKLAGDLTEWARRLFLASEVLALGYGGVTAIGCATHLGVYDLKQNEARVSVGISHDSGEFAVQTVRTWWKEMGVQKYPPATSLLITADGGGSNGYRVGLCKLELQGLANVLGFPIKVRHLPPWTSKWNKIEPRLFSLIKQNW